MAMEYVFHTLTSRVGKLRRELETAGWVFVSSALAPERQAPDNETITALTMAYEM
jgi:hypothetical protein